MSKTILIVDDEADVLSLLLVRVKAMGYEALGAPSAEKALELIEKKKPDLILLDLLLPRMQGEEVCQRLKSDRKLKHVPIVVITANAERIGETVKKICADDHLLKPFESEELLAKIKKFTE